MDLDGLPDDFEVHVTVVVHDVVAHANDFVERNSGKVRTGLRNEPGSSFPCDEQTAKNGILGLVSARN